MEPVVLRAARRDFSAFVHPVAVVVGLVIFAVSPDAFAQQRVIVNPNFVQRLARNGTAMPDYNASVPSFCTVPGSSCLRYLGDARCLPPTGTPVDSAGCMAGWITTDPYDGALAAYLANNVQDGHIKAPTQVAIGPNIEGLNVPKGAAELNAENPGRLYQIVCLNGAEEIPFSYRLGDPTSTVGNSSQARFGVFENNSNYPGDVVGTSFVDSAPVNTATMVL